MKKCEVVAEIAQLVVKKGSVVMVEEDQYEAAKSLLKPVKENKKDKEDK